MHAFNELEGKCNISQVKERLQDNPKSSTRPGNLIPAWSSNHVTGGRKEKALQPLNKDQRPKDPVSDMHEAFISERRLESAVTKDQVAGEWVIEKQDRIHPVLQPHSSGSEPSLSRQRRQKKREQTEHSGEKRQEALPQHLPSFPVAGKVDVMSTQKDAENQNRVITESVSSSRSSEKSSSKDRPLSARERRRLKQSQEERFPSGPSVRISQYQIQCQNLNFIGSIGTH